MKMTIYSDVVAQPISPGRVRRISETIEEMMTLHSVPPTTDPTLFDDEENMALDEVDVLCDSRRDVHDVKSVISVDPTLSNLGGVDYKEITDHTRSGGSDSSGSDSSGSDPAASKTE